MKSISYLILSFLCLSGLKQASATARYSQPYAQDRFIRRFNPNILIKFSDKCLYQRALKAACGLNPHKVQKGDSHLKFRLYPYPIPYPLKKEAGIMTASILRNLDAPELVPNLHYQLLDTKPGYLVLALGTEAYIWSAHIKEITHLGSENFDRQQEVSAVSLIDETNTCAAVGALDGRIEVCQGKKILRTMYHSGSDACVSLALMGHYLVSGYNGALQFDDLSVRDHTVLSCPNAHEGFVSGLCVLDEHTIATGGEDHKVRLWDIRRASNNTHSSNSSWSPLYEFSQHSGPVNVIASHDCYIFTCGGGEGDQVVKRWNWRSGLRRNKMKVVSSKSLGGPITGCLCIPSHRTYVDELIVTAGTKLCRLIASYDSIEEARLNTKKIENEPNLLALGSISPELIAVVRSDEVLNICKLNKPQQQRNSRKRRRALLDTNVLSPVFR